MKTHLVVVSFAFFAVACNRAPSSVTVARADPIGPDAGVPRAEPNAASGKRSAVPNDHRDTATDCDRSPPPPGNPDPKAMGCKSDAECKEGKNARCIFHPGGHAPANNSCEYSECFTDDDCKPSGKVCSCVATRVQRSTCMPGNCRVDTDCGTGGYCSPSSGTDSYGGCGGPIGYYCHKAADTCTNDDDCPMDANGYQHQSCAFHPLLGHWACVSNHACPVG